MVSEQHGWLVEGESGRRLSPRPNRGPVQVNANYIYNFIYIWRV